MAKGRNVTYVVDLDLPEFADSLGVAAMDYGEVRAVDYKVDKKGVKFYITIYSDEKTPKDMELKPEITVWAWRKGK
jgi:hypothetical protein